MNHTLTVSAVLNVLYDVLPKKLTKSKIYLCETIFESFRFEMMAAARFEYHYVCKWMSGNLGFPSDLLAYYTEGKEKIVGLCDHVCRLLPNEYHYYILLSALDRLVRDDDLINPTKKIELINLLNSDECKTKRKIGNCITHVLYHAMLLDSIPNAAGVAKGTKKLRAKSYVRSAKPPKPCQWFQGRTSELEQLSSLLNDCSTVFVNGIPGIGKSEFVKKYAEVYREQYTDIVYIRCDKSLDSAICALDFWEDLLYLNYEERLQNHLHFLTNVLSEDTLLIIDNLNTPPDDEPLLHNLLQAPCHVLVTTRCVFEEQNMFTLGQLDGGDLETLVERIYPASTQKPKIIQKLIKTLNAHTYAIVLAAHVLKSGRADANEVLRKLRKGHSIRQIIDKIRAHKDNAKTSRVIYEHLKVLLTFMVGSEECEMVKRCLLFVPAQGINIRTFAGWLDLDTMDALNYLVDIGFAQRDDSDLVTVHPLIQTIITEEMAPSATNCRPMLVNLGYICLHHGREFANHAELADMVERIAENMVADGDAYYLTFLADAFAYIEKYDHQSCMTAILRKMEELLTDQTHSSPDDWARMLECRAACEDSPERQRQLLEEALMLLNDHNPGTMQSANLMSNLGTLYAAQFGEYDAAYNLIEAALRIMESCAGENGHDLIAMRYNKAMVLFGCGRFKDAQNEIRQLREDVGKAQGTQSIDYAQILYAHASLNISSFEFEEAESCIRDAWDIYRLHYEDALHLLLIKRQELQELIDRIPQFKDINLSTPEIFMLDN